MKAVTGTTGARERVALVTGANKGIGFATAAGLGRLGHTVLVGARDEHRGAEAVARLCDDGVDGRLLLLDITDDASVCRAAREVEASIGRLDVLVNNAAIKLEAAPSPPSECSLAMVRETFETNVFGSIRVVLATNGDSQSARTPIASNVPSSIACVTPRRSPPLNSAPGSEPIDGGGLFAGSPSRNRSVITM